ncbi:MAG: glycine cleavage system aminomethyltransferase GcvT [Acidimicrobiia bacterium]|nr:glycine cleavage system aminomethyltransferase GcvT [Acidimicrobiia bacterium]
MPTTSLREVHAAAGARFTDFGGWEMPLQYEGVIAEHMAVRESVGVFDVSHLGRFEVAGPGAVDAVRYLLCNDIAKIEPGKAQYTMALNDSGGVEDDIIVWWIDDERLWVLPNGVNFDEIMARFAEHAGPETTVRPLRDDTVLLAVQGPDAPGVIESVLGTAPGRFRVATGEFAGHPYVAAGTGYTGERGAEIAVPAESAPALWQAVLAGGAVPCGLGARDTLRLEMGFALWGQDLDETTTPLEAGLGWVVNWDHDFVGKDALLAQKASGRPRALVGFKTGGRRIARHGYAMRAGESIGEVASGNFSPILQGAIGLGYLTPPPKADTPLEIEFRDEWQVVERAKPPFIER